jgi:putative endonuclease
MLYLTYQWEHASAFLILRSIDNAKQRDNHETGNTDPMAKSGRRLTGKRGEELGAAWLQENGFTILHRNWRAGRIETDIIATKEGVLHFIEVKTRRSLSFGNPEDRVDRSKLGRMIDAGSAYLSEHPEWRHICFDILSVRIGVDQKTEFLLIEDVYL